KEIMTPRVDVQAIPADVTLEEARDEAIHQGHSRIPVYENNIDRIVGILYVKDLLRVMNDTHPFNLREILRPALFVPKTKRVSDLLETFKKKKNHIAMVVDEYGLTAGLVTIEDVLEEIVGDIQDEYDQEPPEYEIQPDGTYIADAKINLDILSEVLGIDFPEEDVETLGGFLSSQQGDVPRVGEEIEFKGHRFTVLDSNELRINRVKIARIEPEPDASAPVPPDSAEA
ncbi:MAG TPA: hemolysin family protein, partial [bacterium]|nr:hemolysin family protein [bacterium]